MANNFNMDWSDIQDTPKSDVNYYKMKNDNVLRVASKPSLVEIHWEKDINDKPVRVVCPGVGCPICAVDIKPQKRYMFKAIDREDGKAKIVETGKTVVDGIKALATDEDYGNPANYDIKIKRSGTGRETKYSVIAGKNSNPITAEEKEMLSTMKSIEELNPIKTKEEILALGLKCLCEDFEGDDTEASPSKDNKKSDWDDEDF